MIWIAVFDDTQELCTVEEFEEIRKRMISVLRGRNPAAYQGFMTDFAINCLETGNPDPDLPICILEFIKAMIGFLSGVDDHSMEHDLSIMVDFFKGCQNEHLIDRRAL